MDFKHFFSISKPSLDEKYAARYGPDYEGWYSRGIGGGAAHMKILLGGQ